MNILVVADQWPWPAHQGDRVRLDAICRVLAAHHELTVIGRGSETGPQLSPTIHALEVNTSKSLPRMLRHPVMPVASAIRVSRSVCDSVVQASRHHDKVIFYQLKTTAWMDPRIPRHKVVIDLTDSLALYYRRRGGILWTIESWRALHWERRLASQYPVVVSSEHDRAVIDPAHRYHTVVAPNGYWEPTQVDRRPESGMVIAVGHWSYYPNRAGIRRFAESVWPKLHGLRPNFKLWVVGRGGNPLTQPVKGIEWVGEVEDLLPWYQRAMVAVAPVYVGSGMKTKIMEALFLGVPVVATQFAIEGIEAVPIMRSARDDAEFVQQIIAQFDAPSSWNPSARSAFLRRNAWGETLRPLVDLLLAEGER